MPQGGNASPGWFVKVINEVIKGLAQVAAYLDDVMIFDSDPAAHIKRIVDDTSPLRTPAPTQPQALPLEGSPWRHGRKIYGPLHFARGYTPQRGKTFGLDEIAHAQEPQAGPCADGRRGILSQIPVRPVYRDPPSHRPSPEGG